MSFWARKHVLITGASRGLGLEFTRQLARVGAYVTATCRAPDEAPALEALAGAESRVNVALLDTGDAETALTVAARIDTLDVLINNAGIATDNHPLDPIVEARSNDLNKVFATNVVGSIETTNAFLNALRRGQGKTIVMLSSDLGSIEGTFTAQSATVAAGGVTSYRISKAGVNMAARIYAAELAPEGFTVVALSPGWVATDMGSSGDRVAPLTPSESVAGCIDVIASLGRADNGRFLRYDGVTLSW